MKNKIIFGILLVFLFLSRFYNLEKTVKINRDEASDLVKIHQYWVEKKISLIGPISENGNMVYSSLSYYLVMPFAVFLGFSAVSPAFGAAFWGFWAVIFLILTIKRQGKMMTFLAFFMLIVLFPLIETGRWCWNPNFIPFWLVLGIYLYRFDKKLLMFLSGLAMGAVVHHHYLGIIPVVGWGLVTIVDYWKKDKLKIIMFALGSLIPLSAFVLFDLTHPPGLFLTRALYFNQTQGRVNYEAIKIFASYLFGGSWRIYVGGLLTILLLFVDRFEWKKLKYLLPVLLQLVVNSFVGSLQSHYFIAGVIFYILWLFVSREKYAKFVQITLVVFLIAVNIRPALEKILVTQELDNAYMIDKVVDIIVDDIKSDRLINANVAALQSDDINSVGLKYREMLLLNDQKILSQDEYGISDNLYVITIGNEESLRNDPSTQMQIFKNGVLKNKWSVPDTGWFVYRFDKY